MKRVLVLFFSVALLLSFASCFQGEVETSETQDFVGDFETMAMDPSQKLDSEDEIVAVAAMSDFFNKGGAVKALEIPMSLIGIEYDNSVETKVFEENYGTYEWDDVNYEWVLVDDATPTDGFLYKWTFIDSVGGEHDAEFLFNELSFYEDTLPTHFFAGLSVDGQSLEELEFEATYSGTGEDLMLTHTQATLTFVGYSEIEVELNGSIYLNSEDDGDISWIDDARIRFTDLVENYWEEYSIVVHDEDNLTFTYENSDGWKLETDLAHSEEDAYDKIVITGEITKDGDHAADIDGVIWLDEYGNLVMDETHTSYLNIIYPDGTIENVMADMGGTAGKFILNTFK